MPLNPADDCFLSALEGALPQGRLRAPKPHELAEPRGRGAVGRQDGPTSPDPLR